MRMVGIEEQDATLEEAVRIYAKKIAQFDADYLEKTANDEFKQAGVICLNPEEFFASEHSKIISAEPLWATRSLPAPRSAWPVIECKDLKPLAGIRVIDFKRLVAGPIISKVFAVLGANVVKISNKNSPDIAHTSLDLNTGKKDVSIDIRVEEGKKTFAKLVEGADILVDGYRPGVLARLGFSSESLRLVNRQLIYIRENFYGFKGPLAHRSGYMPTSDCLVGISWIQGRFLGLDEPVFLPFRKWFNFTLVRYLWTDCSSYSSSQLGFLTDLAGAAETLQALLECTKSDATFDIDVSLTQSKIWNYCLGQYTNNQCEALLRRCSGFHARHYDDAWTLISRANAVINEERPEIMKRPRLFLEDDRERVGLAGTYQHPGATL